jgi:hypothetical protein
VCLCAGAWPCADAHARPRLTLVPPLVPLLPLLRRIAPALWPRPAQPTFAVYKGASKVENFTGARVDMLRAVLQKHAS